MTRAWITPREMEHLAARTGFTTIAVLGDFDGTPWTPKHTEMIWHFRRPGQMDSEITSRGWQDSGSCNAIFGGSNIVIKYAYIYVIRVFHGLFVIKKFFQNERTKQVRSLVGAREDGLMACARNSCGILYSVLLVLSNFRLQNFILAYHGADLACVMDIHSWSTGPE